MSDPMSAGERICSYMNKDRQVSLVLFAWCLLGETTAKRAKLLSLDLKGFELEISLPTGKTIEKRYAFTRPLNDYSEAREKLMSLHGDCSLAWPPSHGAISVLLWVVSSAAYFELVPISFLSKSIGQNLLLLTLFLHFLEMLYVSYICQKLYLSVKSTLIWATSTLILGYPMTKQAMYLNSLTKKEKEHST